MRRERGHHVVCAGLFVLIVMIWSLSLSGVVWTGDEQCETFILVIFCVLCRAGYMDIGN